MQSLAKPVLIQLRYPVFLLLCASASIAEESLVVSGDGAKLNLFMSSDEQRSLEQSSSEHSLLDSDVVLEDEPVPKSEASDADESRATAGLVKYDGIVLKRGVVLGVWFDGKRLSGAAVVPGVDLSEVEDTGRLRLTKGGSTDKIYPGDTIFPAVFSLQGDSNEASSEN